MVRSLYSLNGKTKLIHIKYLYISKENDKTTQHLISIVTDNYEYVDFILQIKKPYISHDIAKRIRRAFQKYEIDVKTFVAVNELIHEKSPIYVYIMFLHQHIQFNLRRTPLDIAIRRIATYHRTYLHNRKPSTIDRKYANKIWNKLIELEKCPWITQNIEYDLQNLSTSKYTLKRNARLVMYYAVVKDYITNIHRKPKSSQI